MITVHIPGFVVLLVVFLACIGACTVGWCIGGIGLDKRLK